MDGQIPKNLAMPLHISGISVLCTLPVNIDKAEDRHKFSQLLNRIGIDQPEWKELTSIKEGEQFADEVGHPFLI